ncbi:MAG: glutathione S-transferase N-terminal domain-containing protein [Candidatus Niyogibacteria bacterium]|nr:glutathione S-transferase N-terminal domain-containing protein [Candidatus Niyogibacteria bacterium]
MLILYVKTRCPFCEKVLRRARELGIALKEHNIAEPRYLEELMQKGGKRQVPFLVDEERAVSMYESDDIVRYLEERKK